MIHLFLSVLVHIAHPTLLLVCFPEAPVSCYRIEPGTIAGIVCADVLLTLVIVIVTYQCASYRHKKMDKCEATGLNESGLCVEVYIKGLLSGWLL